MPIIDLHCDTITELLRLKKSLKKNELNVSIEKLLASDVLCQFFAIFVKLENYETIDEAWEYYLKVYSKFDMEITQNSDSIALSLNYDDILKNRSEGKISAFLTVEEGGICGDKLKRLDELHQMGVRLITLTWNYENSIGFPNSSDVGIMSSGLKTFGKDFVKKMNSLGMLIDVSHLSDKGFWDVVELSKYPFVASHSNARAITNVTRNLDDPMLKALADKGGVTGINFFSKFLGDDGQGSVEQMVTHINHIKNVAGIDVIAVGSDFDGFTGNCEIKDSSEYIKLIEALKAEKYTSEEIDKITYKNAARVIQEVVR